VADERIDLLTHLAGDVLLEHGYTEIRGAPGDQQELPRTATRRYDRAAADAVGRVLQGQEFHPASLPDWRLSCDTWAPT
jgi:hypothetical protein